MQDVPKGLTFILLIDDQVPTGFVGRFQLKTSDNFGKITDSILFDYEVGRLVFHTDADYKKFIGSDNKLKVTFQFHYQSPYPEENKYFYTEEMLLRYFKEKYMIFRVYNYSNKKNRGKFFQKKGYGAEYQIQSLHVDLLRKKY